MEPDLVIRIAPRQAWQQIDEALDVLALYTDQAPDFYRATAAAREALDEARGSLFALVRKGYACKAVCDALVAAYKAGADAGGSVAWEDIDDCETAAQVAVAAYNEES